MKRQARSQGAHADLARAQVDLDIAGPQNSVRQDFIELEQKAFPWSQPGENGPNSSAVTLQKRLRAVMPETEEAASLGYDPRAPVVVSVVNERSANKWGTPQGYKIQVRCPPLYMKRKTLKT